MKLEEKIREVCLFNRTNNESFNFDDLDTHIIFYVENEYDSVSFKVNRLENSFEIDSKRFNEDVLFNLDKCSDDYILNKVAQQISILIANNMYCEV